MAQRHYVHLALILSCKSFLHGICVLVKNAHLCCFRLYFLFRIAADPCNFDVSTSLSRFNFNHICFKLSISFGYSSIFHCSSLHLQFCWIFWGVERLLFWFCSRGHLRSAWTRRIMIFVPVLCACGTFRSFPFVHIVFRRVRLYC